MAYRPIRSLAWLWWLFFLLLLWQWAVHSNSTSRSTPPLAEGATYWAIAIDGDTLEIPDHQRIRLIGVDTPETVKPNHPVEPFGPEATAFTREFIAETPVRLEFDHERTDNYGRLLAYVWVGKRLLNEELLKAGLAQYEPQYRYSAAMHRRFQKAERQAKSKRLGIWSESDRPAENEEE